MSSEAASNAETKAKVFISYSRRDAAGFADELRNGPHATPGYRATAAWSGTRRVPLVTQPTLVLRAGDRDGESAARAARLMRAARLDDVPGAGFLAGAADGVASRLRRFLDR